MLFSLLKHYLNTDTTLKVSQSVYCFTTFISHGVENYFPRLLGTGISDAIFVHCVCVLQMVFTESEKPCSESDQTRQGADRFHYRTECLPVAKSLGLNSQVSSLTYVLGENIWD